MWRLLLQAGLGFATFDVGRRIARLKRSAVYYAIAGVIGLLGLGALTAAAAIALEPKLGAAGAAAVVGGVLVLVALLVAVIGARDVEPKRKNSPVVERVSSEFGAASSAFSASRARRAAARASAAGDTIAEELADPAAKRKKAINMVLIATLAGVILGRRL